MLFNDNKNDCLDLFMCSLQYSFIHKHRNMLGLLILSNQSRLNISQAEQKQNSSSNGIQISWRNSFPPYYLNYPYIYKKLQITFTNITWIWTQSCAMCSSFQPFPSNPVHSVIQWKQLKTTAMVLNLFNWNMKIWIPVWGDSFVYFELWNESWWEKPWRKLVDSTTRNTFNTLCWITLEKSIHLNETEWISKLLWPAKFDL